MRYTYLGDLATRSVMVGMQCDPVLRKDGKCVISTRMATAMVKDTTGQLHVVKRRRLRVNK